MRDLTDVVDRLPVYQDVGGILRRRKDCSSQAMPARICLPDQNALVIDVRKTASGVVSTASPLWTRA